MVGKGASSALTILEYLIIHLWHEKKEEPEGFSALGGTLVVSVDVDDSVQCMSQSRCEIIIAAKGKFCYKLLGEQIYAEMKSLLPCLPLCQNKALGGSWCPHESLPTMPLQLSFELYEKSGMLKEDCIALKQFIQRISLVHTMIKFHYCVRVNGSISAGTYSSGRRDSSSSTCMPDGTRLLSDARNFVRSVGEGLWSCAKIHPVAGEPVNLFVPDQIAERGFSGGLRLTPAVTLCPCLTQFPNLPAKLVAISIFLYDPAGLPVLFLSKEGEELQSFLENPSHLAAWERYGYKATLNSDAIWKEDTARPDVRYKLHNDLKQDPQTREQTLLLFLFLGDRRVILSHLYPILSCSEEAVKGAIQSVIHRILEQHYKVTQEQQKVARALPIVINAISSIVSSSTESIFRRKCLHHLQVADNQELLVAIQETFSQVTCKRWKSSPACDIKRPLLKDEAEQFQRDCAFSSAGLETGEHDHCGEEGSLLSRLDSARMSQTKRRRRTASVEDSRDPSVSREADGKRGSEGPGTSLLSSFAHPAAFSYKSQGRLAAPRADGADGAMDDSSGKPWQDDDFWNQEVSNLSEWAS